MPKKSIKKLRAAAKVKQSPDVKKKSQDSTRKKHLGKKNRLHAKINGTLEFGKSVVSASKKKKQSQLTALEKVLIKNTTDDSASATIKSAAAASSTSVSSNKNKLKGAVAVRESERMKMVMAHPDFSLALVKEHLKQTQQARKK